MQAVRRVFREEFGGADVFDYFSAFEAQPIAAASLAQVHRAETLDGRRVAVKVQYPGLHSQVAADVRTMDVGLCYPMRVLIRA